jgi:hypothetical protein
MKKSFFSLVAMLAVGFILAEAGCSSTPSVQEQNEWLLTCANTGRLAGVQYAVERGGANINYGNRTYRQTALMIASGRGHLNIVQYLVKNGADVNLRDSDNETALIWAINNGHTTIAGYLIDSGTNINARNNQGKSALNIAYEKGEMDIYDYLIHLGAVRFEPNQVTQQPTAPAPQTVYVQEPSTPAQSPDPAPSQRTTPAPSAPTFQTGTYAWSNSGVNMTMQFSAGIVTTQLNYRQAWWGTYRINGTEIVISVTSATGDYSRLQGMTYSYTITSSTSFSASGETWVRTGY